MLEYEREIKFDLSKPYEPNYLNSQFYNLTGGGYQIFPFGPW